MVLLHTHIQKNIEYEKLNVLSLNQFKAFPRACGNNPIKILWKKYINNC